VTTVGPLDRSFTVSKDAIFRELDGEAVVLHLGTGTYFGLNAVGARIWQLLEQHRLVRTVLDELCREYDAAPDVLERDLLALLSELEQARLGEVG
jgi:hypothetical protein